MNITQEMNEIEMNQNILELANEGYTYREIQLKLGNPSKKRIRQVIKNGNRELAGMLRDTKALNNYRNGKN